ncbi:MAG: hypothetical protein ACREP7_02760 [Lysobacter sp.]
MNKAAPPQDALLHASALLIAIAVTLFTGWLLLLAVPAPPPVAHDMDVILIESIVPVTPIAAPAPETQPETQPEAAAPRDPTRVPRPTQSAPPPPDVVFTKRPPDTKPNIAAPANSRLYTADGRVALNVDPTFDPMRKAAGHAPGDLNDPKRQAALNAFERPNPIQAQPSAFASDWETDGTLGQVLIGKANKRLKKIVDKLPWRRDIQQATARPPPPVRFNPALHERPSDLGSEATGDAYKAAPIAFEPAPGLQGEASHRIRKAIGEVEADFGACDRKRLRELLAPAIERIDELQKIERAMASGVDPIRAEELLPRSADMAYDQARRAIWYARKQLATCAK